ncbi:MAG: hypothetical protein IMZ55_19100 [Acidobacteria bacterium]|nr:hypothetical protein [Planctomycetota bacterium]MBE3135580.1 hypothetical protein [Acidobacteriota bacterium]
MMMTSRKMLGLAVTERSITAVEVACVRGSRKVLHAAEFPLPQDDAAREAAPLLGKALRQFLRQNHFSASRCVIGIGAKGLVAREKSLPPTSPDLLAGALSIATEREFASDAKDLVFDYSGPVDSAQGQSVLLVAASRQNVDHLLATARAAGLTVAAVTSSTLALASATRLGGPSPRRLVLYLSPSTVELSVQSGGGTRLLRHLPISPPAAAAHDPSLANGWLDVLAGELRRVVALLPGSQAPEQALDLVIWNASGLAAGALADLGKRLSLAARLCQSPSDLEIADGPAWAGESAAAAALAAVGLNRQLLAVDFLHSRLSPRRKITVGRKAVWAAALAAAVILPCLVLFLAWRAQQGEVDDLKGQLDAMQPSIAAARDIVHKATFAGGWYDQRPRHLDCLRELTLAFPAEGRIWTTSLAISEDMRVLLSGKAADQRAVLEVVDHLNGNPKFADVQSLHISEVGGGSLEWSFAISLRFIGASGS